MVMSLFVNPILWGSVSTIYTLYNIHPYIPYNLIWHNVVIPGNRFIFQYIKSDDDFNSNVEMYEAISTTDVDTGIVTKHIIFEKSPTFTFIGVEYVDDDYWDGCGPVYL